MPYYKICLVAVCESLDEANVLRDRVLSLRTDDTRGLRVDRPRPSSLHEIEHSSVDLRDLVIPDHWTDESWHNDGCPSFGVPFVGNSRLKIWIDDKDPNNRNIPGWNNDNDKPRTSRFALEICDDDGNTTPHHSTDDFDDLKQWVEAYLKVVSVTEEAAE